MTWHVVTKYARGDWRHRVGAARSTEKHRILVWSALFDRAPQTADTMIS